MNTSKLILLVILMTNGALIKASGVGPAEFRTIPMKSRYVKFIQDTARFDLIGRFGRGTSIIGNILSQTEIETIFRIARATPTAANAECLLGQATIGYLRSKLS